MTVNVAKLIACTLIAVLLAACATTDPQLPQTVEERAQARWDYLIGGNAGAAWDFYTPGFRETYDRRDFAYDIARRPVRWLGAEVERAECDGDRCTVYSRVRYDVPSARSGMSAMQNTRGIEETWIRVDGQWWYVPPTL